MASWTEVEGLLEDELGLVFWLDGEESFTAFFRAGGRSTRLNKFQVWALAEHLRGLAGLLAEEPVTEPCVLNDVRAVQALEDGYPEVAQEALRRSGRWFKPGSLRLVRDSSASRTVEYTGLRGASPP